MKIVCTGGAGYIGCVLSKLLIANGHEVVVLDAGLFGFDGLPPHVEVVPWSMEGDPPRRQLEGVDAIVHLGGISNDPTAEFSPERTWAVNVDGTKRLVDAAREVGVPRVVLASSASVYDRHQDVPTLFTEASPVEPVATYSRSKVAGESLLLNSGIPCATVLRKGTVFGWSPRIRWDLVVHTMVRDALWKG